MGEKEAQAPATRNGGSARQQRDCGLTAHAAGAQRATHPVSGRLWSGANGDLNSSGLRAVGDSRFSGLMLPPSSPASAVTDPARRRDPPADRADERSESPVASLPCADRPDVSGASAARTCDGTAEPGVRGRSCDSRVPTECRLITVLSSAAASSSRRRAASASCASVTASLRASPSALATALSVASPPPFIHGYLRGRGYGPSSSGQCHRRVTSLKYPGGPRSSTAGAGRSAAVALWATSSSSSFVLPSSTSSSWRANRDRNLSMVLNKFAQA